MIKPTIHLNGTSAEELIEKYEKAAADADVLLRCALADTAPNARDFYPQGDDAFRQATREHESRIQAIRTVRDELVGIWEDLLEQNDRRSRR